MFLKSIDWGAALNCYVHAVRHESCEQENNLSQSLGVSKVNGMI